VNTECTQRSFDFHRLGKRQVTARFDGGDISSDGGALLLRRVEERTQIVRQFAACFADFRNQDLIEHEAADLIAQRVYGLALGYEDLNDHDDLRRDPLLASIVGKADVKGRKRRREQDRGKALAGRSTLNRLELTRAGASARDRYKKIELDFDAVDQLLVRTYLDSFATPPQQVVLDVDATDDPLHGRQEGRFFHGYYDSYCYLPLYIFAGDHLLSARLRTAETDPAKGALEDLAGLVAAIRQSWPKVEIVVRGDSGFCREELMAWCEASGVQFVFGLARNPRLERIIRKSMRKAKSEHVRTHQPARRFKNFHYRTRSSWSRSRRVVGKAEVNEQGENPRFVVTSFDRASWGDRELYEDLYCARGEMENRIKEQKTFLFATRTSTHWLRSNQIRLYFSSIAYLLMSALRRLGLAGTTMAEARCDTIRLRLFKIGALIQVSARRVWVSLASACPYAAIFTAVFDNLGRAPPG
jgi:hypothetical protein